MPVVLSVGITTDPRFFSIFPGWVLAYNIGMPIGTVGLLFRLGARPRSQCRSTPTGRFEGPQLDYEMAFLVTLVVSVLKHVQLNLNVIRTRLLRDVINAGLNEFSA